MVTRVLYFPLVYLINLRQEAASVPFVESLGVRIYYHLVGEGAPLVLQHGFASSSGIWHRLGWINALKTERQVIAIDARGHGASSKPHTPSAYGVASFVADIVAVLDALDIERADYMGYSMGSWIGFGLARFRPERLRALILGGAGPECERCTAFHDLDGQQADGFVEALETMMGEPLMPRTREALKANDLRALTALMQHTPDEPPWAPALPGPALLFAGTADVRYATVAQCAARLPNAEFIALPGRNHFQAIADLETLAPRVVAFLRKRAPHIA
jgi:pimeloyl-ACP methyl ester carboxylesterase